MKEKPTTFQLAQLAAAVPPPIQPKDAVKRAWEMWHEAETEIAEHDNRDEFLRNLFWTHDGKNIPLFTDSPKDWQARIKSYPGDQRDVNRAMWNREFSNEEVQKQLFRDKTLSRDTRRRLLLKLAKVSIMFEMDGPPIAYQGRLDYLKAGPLMEPQDGFPIHPRNWERAKENHNGVGKMLIPANEFYFVRKVEELLAKPKLNAHLVRWAAEVRQRQLAASKTRIIPKSLRRRRAERDRDESIQFKKKIIQ